MQLKGVLILCGIRIMIPLDGIKEWSLTPLESSQKESYLLVRSTFIVYFCDRPLSGGIYLTTSYHSHEKENDTHT